MKSISKNVSNELIINKSKFITFLFKIDKFEDIDIYLKHIKKKYIDATHYCYAYIIDDKIKCNDDKEPSGTAGIPILNVLKNNDLNYILCIVVRYFGGIKLGASGLLRAYSNSAIEALKKASICNLISGKKIKLEFVYDDIKQIDYLLKNSNITNKKYNEFITYEVDITNSEFDLIINSLNKICKVEIIEEKNITN